MSYTIKVIHNGVMVKTELSFKEIVFYTAKILKIKEWEDTLYNRAQAKVILDALVILEAHLQLLFEQGLYKARPPYLKFNFNELWAYMRISTKEN